MEGQKCCRMEGGEGQQASERMFTKARRHFRRRQSPCAARDFSAQVENNSSKKRSWAHDNLLNCVDILAGNKNYKRPRTLATDHVIPAGNSADEAKANISPIEVRFRSLSLRPTEKEYLPENNRSRKRKSLSRENENLKHAWLRPLNRLRDRGPARASARARARACARAEETNTAGAAEQFPSIYISEQHVNDKCLVCEKWFEIGEDGCEMPCSHMFHKKCIFEWLSRSATCPVCCYNFRSPPYSSSSAYNNSRSGSPYLFRSNGSFSAYRSYCKEFSDSPFRRLPTES